MKVNEIDVPKPDYSEIRRNISSIDEILDPRLRRIFTLGAQTKNSSPNLDEENEYSTITDLVYRPQDNVETKPVPAFTTTDVCAPRLDPRRKHKETDKISAESTLSLTSGSASTTSRSAAINLDMQSVLRQSVWYKDLSSKHKIMVNQQLAIVSAELKKFHQDQSVDKTFDLTFANQNQLLQQVLTNLGIYIDENGYFVKFAVRTQNLNGYHQANDGISDMGGVLPGINFIRPPPLVSMNTNRFMNTNSIMFGGTDSGVIRPGLLGLAPGIPFNSYDKKDDLTGIYQQPQQQQHHQQNQIYEDFTDAGGMCTNSGGVGVASLFDAPIMGGFNNILNNGGYFGGGNGGNIGPRNHGNLDRLRVGGSNNASNDIRNYRAGNRQGNNSDRWGTGGGGGLNVARNGNNMSGGGRHSIRRNNYDNRDRSSRRDKN